MNVGVSVMFPIYLTPASISFLTQFILSLSITIFMVSHRENKNPQLLLLNGFFVSMTIFIGLLFLDSALTPFYRLLAVYAQNTILALALVFLLQFAYRFPQYFSQHKWETHLSLVVSLAYFVWEAYYMVYRYYALLVQEMVYYRSHFFIYAMAGVMLIAPIAFLRQSITADPGNANWLRKLWKPEVKDAHSARNFVLIFGIMFVLGIFNVFLIFGLSHTIYNAAMSIGVLVALWLFAANYINFIPGGASIQLKVSALSLTLFLALLGAVGWIIAPSYIVTFRPNLTDRQTLRFTPNDASGYDVTEVAFAFESDLGEKVSANEASIYGEGRNHKLDYTFPFYGQTYDDIYIANSGAISLGEPFWQPNMQAIRANIPAIFPLMIDLDPEPDRGGGVYARLDEDRLILTWDHLPIVQRPEEIFTFQVILYPNGIFDITYNGLPLPFIFNPDATPSANPWMRGVVSGEGEPLHTNDNDLVATALAGESPLIENYQLAFRRYLHGFMLPLTGIIVGGSLAILIVLPLLLRFAVAKPLGALSAGVREMQSGNLMIEIPVQNEDEIGFLTHSFNVMAARLDELVVGLEERFQEFFENEPDYCYMVSPEGTILDANPAVLAILGYEKNELVGESLNMIYAPESKEKAEQLLKNWKKIGSLTNEEIVIITKSAETRTVLLSAWTVRDRDGTLAHFLAIQRDITDRRQAQARIMEQQRLLAAMDERTHLHRKLHDGLGQVLSYINVQVEAVQSLLEKEQIAAAKTNLSQLAHASHDAQVELREHLLGLSQNAASRSAPSAPKSLLDVLPEYLEQFQLRHGLEINLWVPEIDTDPLFSSSVDEQATHIIREALTNIVKHAQASRVDIDFQVLDGQVQIMISDDGVGFQPSEIENESADATHYGLNIMRERAEYVGGNLNIRTAPGKGTRVIVTLPNFIILDEDDEMIDIKGLRILLADDHPLFLDGLRNLLEARGLSVVGTARDGLEAIEKVRTLRPDIAILDVNMPRLNGIEATKAIKAEMPDVKVVILTIPGSEDHLYEAIKSGASGYLFKDLEANQLCQLLVGLLRGEVALSPGIAERMMTDLAEVEKPGVVAPDQEKQTYNTLTQRQWEILEKVADGLTYKEVGIALSITEETVKYHMRQIVERLNVENRTQAIARLHQIRPK